MGLRENPHLGCFRVDVSTYAASESIDFLERFIKILSLKSVFYAMSASASIGTLRRLSRDTQDKFQMKQRMMFSFLDSVSSGTDRNLIALK